MIALASIHLLFYYLACFTDDHPFLWHMVTMLRYELYLAVTIGICGLIVFLAKGLLHIYGKLSQITRYCFRRRGGVIAA